MFRAFGRALALTLATAVGLSAAATTAVTFSDTKLKNGLRVIISEDHTAPTVSVVVIYNVGSADEKAGRTGFAHLFEHMMFKGSENVGPGEHPALIFNNGGKMNGTTNAGSHALLRVAAGQPARARAVPRGRPHALARDQQGQSRQPAQRRSGRAPAARRQPAVRRNLRAHRRAGLRQSRPTSTRRSDRWPT